MSRDGRDIVSLTGRELSRPAECQRFEWFNRPYQRNLSDRLFVSYSLVKSHDGGQLTVRTKPPKTVPGIHLCMSTAMAPDLTSKQQRILEYLRNNAATKTYFKSRLIGKELGMTAKEVGSNITALQEGDYDVEIEKWGYSSSTTWKVDV